MNSAAYLKAAAFSGTGLHSQAVGVASKQAVCSVAIQTSGGYGYVEDLPVERIYRDARVCQIYEGTSDIQKIIIGRTLQS